MNAFQQYQGYGQPFAPRLVGRAVKSVADIGVVEVPTDGSTGWFPAVDGSCVWGKKWSGNGTIETVRYVPEPREEPEDPLAVLTERVAALEAAISKKAKRREQADEDD